MYTRSYAPPGGKSKEACLMGIHTTCMHKCTRTCLRVPPGRQSEGTCVTVYMPHILKVGHKMQPGPD